MKRLFFLGILFLGLLFPMRITAQVQEMQQLILNIEKFKN